MVGGSCVAIRWSGTLKGPRMPPRRRGGEHAFLKINIFKCGNDLAMGVFKIETPN